MSFLLLCNTAHAGCATLRSIKCSLQMDVLRCKSPEMVRKEISMHLVA